MADVTLSPRLQELLDSGELDWDNPRHREAYLREWLKAPRKHQEADDDDSG